jgi:hypothetical protein
LVGLLTTTLVVAGPAVLPASYQSTKTEGLIGVDLGGIWLAVHQVAPTFRVRLQLTEDKQAPFEAGPVPEHMKPLVGPGQSAVVIAKAINDRSLGSVGLFVGDLVVRINEKSVGSVEEFAEKIAALENDWVSFTVRRPSLAHSTARLLKISYSAEVEEVDGTSAIAREIVRLTVGDGILPFQDRLDATRKDDSLFVPSADDLKTLAEGWHRLPLPEAAVFIGAEHRVVAADNYDLGLRQDNSLEGTRFAIISTLKGNPGRGGGTTIGIYGIREVAADEIAGSYVESTLANAPFPVSIDFNGSFFMKKVAEFSHKDSEHLQSQKAKVMGAEKSFDDIELEPDIPADLGEE